MPSDMRDELVEHIREHCSSVPPRHIPDVLDSVPPNTFKNEKDEWVRLQFAGGWGERLYTEVDHAE